MERTRIEVEGLPELETAVGISGSAKQHDVAGALCLGIAAGIALYLGTS